VVSVAGALETTYSMGLKHIKPMQELSF